MLIITDINGNTEALTGYKGLKRYRNVNGEKTLAFLILPTEQNAHSYPMVSEESVIDFDGEPYRIKQIAEKSRGTTFIKEVIAVHTFFDLIDDHVYALHSGSMTFASAVQFVLGDTEYTWSIVDQFYAQDFENFGDENRLALFQTLLERYGAEFTLNGTHITFRQRIGNATDFQFRYNYNVKTITRDIKTSNLSTYIKGFGKKNEDGTYAVEAEYTSPNAAVFGIRHAKPVRDERYTTVEGLNTRLQAELIDEPEVSITIDFADLRRAGFPYDVPSEGDDVFLIYEPIGIDIETRLVDIDEEFAEDSLLPIRTTVTLGNIRDSVVDRWASVEKQVSDIIGSDGKVKYNVLDAAVKRATEALQSAQTELEFDNGIIARDKNNPNFLVLFNAAGLGISTDGGQTFRQAITSQGVVTDVLTAGQIDANNISVRGGGETDYSLIDANGFFAKGTAFTVERPDGYKLINNGVANFEFATDMHDPPFRDSGVNINGYWFTTASTVPVSGNYYTFKHTARYLKMQVAFYKTGDGNTGGIRIAKNGNILLVGKSFTNGISDQAAVVGEILTVDLGVPTGEVVSVYLQGYQDIANGNVYFRKIRAWLEG
ncbi:phage minor structural protein [Bacillus niacini]|uniref:Phage minor structural protein n=1 Tax=Neobacillus niacini TaxID=86668 RepID=A0A852TJJ4_9BACI|nr:phage tail protein [Neobacillus niacini]NYE07274.1 phage minor structural protein [Neobacillus niacini]